MSALLLGGTMVGCAAQPGGLAAISDAASGRAVDQAALAAASAKTAISNHKGSAAVASAEAAVGWSPQNASYRVLLGQSYIAAGRFLSARDAFADALTLMPQDGHVALNLALAQTASGDWNAARKTLADHADTIPAADRGLAIALAGDPGTAVQILTEAARAPGSDAKTRQNLALSLALAGRWPEAKAVAALDLGADEVDRRMEEWAAFAYPKTAAQQVASLLGVTAIEDHGQPVALALSGNVPVQANSDAPVVMATAAPVAEQPAPQVAAVAPVTAPADEIAAARVEAVVVASAPVANARPTISFGVRSEVVQPLPIAAEQRAKPAARVAMVRDLPSTNIPKGNFYVQLGAYENAGVARDGWARATRRFAGFSGHQPQGMSVTTNGITYYRLSVGGFARNEANALCQSYRAKGGACFVRVGAGDQVARWVPHAGVTQLAMR